MFRVRGRRARSRQIPGESNHILDVAPQALELLNGKTSNDLAGAFAARLLKERGTASERIERAWRLAAGRVPTADEKTLAMQFLASNADDPAKVKEFALAVFNLNAFLYVN